MNLSGQEKSASKGKVDLLLEIVKPSTKATPVSMENMRNMVLAENRETVAMGRYSSFVNDERRDPVPLTFTNELNSVAISPNVTPLRPHHHNRRTPEIDVNFGADADDIIDFGEAFNENHHGCMRETVEDIRDLFRTKRPPTKGSPAQHDSYRRELEDALSVKSSHEHKLLYKLTEIKTSSIEMERVLQEQISKALAEKAVRQAQLNAKLMAIVEQRLQLEIMLGNVTVEEEQLRTKLNEKLKAIDEKSLDTSISIPGNPGHKVPLNISQIQSSSRSYQRHDSSIVPNVETGILPSDLFSPTHRFSAGNTPMGAGKSFFDSQSKSSSIAVKSVMAKKASHPPSDKEESAFAKIEAEIVETAE